MKKASIVFLTTLCVLIAGLWIFKPQTLSPKKRLAFSSEKMLEEYKQKKMKRRLNGYAKPDQPDKFQVYKERLKDNGGISSYQNNYKEIALKSALKNKASLKSTQSQDWKWRGPGNVGGRTRSIIVDPDDNTRQTWFAGSVSGGIWKTTNGGNSWDLISPEITNMSTVCLVMAPSNSSVIYAGTGEGYYNIASVQGNGVYKSTDKGQTWEQLNSTTDNSDFYYVNSIVISSANENILWAATNKGVFKSTDGGTTWNITGLERGLYQRILIHPENDQILWAARNNKGIYKTGDGGENWILVYDLEGVERIEITVSANDPDVLYALDESSQVYYSLDGGTEWNKAVENGTATEFLGGQGWYNNTIAVDLTDSKKGFIGGIDFYSFDLGSELTTNKRKAFAINNEVASTIVFDYFEGNYAEGGIQLYDNFNTVGEEIQLKFGASNQQKAHLLTHPLDNTDFTGSISLDIQSLDVDSYVDVPFTAYNTTTGEQLEVSFIDYNGNGKFDLYEGAYEVILIHQLVYNEAGMNNSVIFNDGDFAVMAALNPALADRAVWDESNLPELNFSYNCYNIYDRVLTANKLTNWTVSKTNSNYSHADHHTINIIEDVGAPFSIVMGNDGGVFYSSNGGASWEERTTGYITSQFYGISRHPSKYIYWGGMQDNGTQLSSEDPEALSEWQDIIGGDGFDVVWHPRNPQKLLGSVYYNQLFFTNDGGDSWRDVTDFLGDSGDEEKAPFLTKVASCVADPDLLFTGSQSGVWKSDNFGVSWTKTSMGNSWGYTDYSLPKISISEADPDVVWAGVRLNESGFGNQGKIHVSTDGGNNFTALNTGLTMGVLSNLVADPTDRETAYLLFSFADYPKVLRTTDMGQNWEDITGFGINGSADSDNGFPDVAVNTLLVMPFNPNEIWVGTEIGLFISVDNGLTWNISDNIPAVSVWDLKIAGDEVLIGTHGLGIWTVIRDELSMEIKNPYIQNVGLNPKGNVALSVEYLSALDSVELFADDSYVRTLYNVELGITISEVSVQSVIPQKFYITGYKTGKAFASNRVSLDIETSYAPLESYVNDFSSKLDDFYGDGFTINKSFFENSAVHTEHPYPSNQDLIYYLKYPIIISENSSMAFLGYYDIAFLETGEDGSGYPNEDFYDYVVIEGSTDGVNWIALKDGYDFSYAKKWASDGRSYGDDPTTKDFVSHTINLWDHFQPNDTVLFRFVLHSDPYETGWGWILDNFHIQSYDIGIRENNTFERSLKIYPNPISNGVCYIELSNEFKGDVEISITDVAGRLYVKQSFLKNADDFKQMLNLNNLPKGTYIIHINLQGAETSEKLIVI